MVIHLRLWQVARRSAPLPAAGYLSRLASTSVASLYAYVIRKSSLISPPAKFPYRRLPIKIIIIIVFTYLLGHILHFLSYEVYRSTGSLPAPYRCLVSILETSGHLDPKRTGHYNSLIFMTVIVIAIHSIIGSYWLVLPRGDV